MSPMALPLMDHRGFWWFRPSITLAQLQISILVPHRSFIPVGWTPIFGLSPFGDEGRKSMGALGAANASTRAVKRLGDFGGDHRSEIAEEIGHCYQATNDYCRGNFRNAGEGLSMGFIFVEEAVRKRG